jgi:hypothetical protein
MSGLFRTALAGAVIATALLAAGCTRNLSVRSQSASGGGYLVRADACMVVDYEELMDPVRERAARICPRGYVLGDPVTVVSRKGSLFGECPHGRAVQVPVACHRKESTQ